MLVYVKQTLKSTKLVATQREYKELWFCLLVKLNEIQCLNRYKMLEEIDPLSFYVEHSHDFKTKKKQIR